MDIATFASGSTGNCALVCAAGAHILIDAGISTKRIICNLGYAGLNIDDLDAILITHEHSDHVKGLATLIKRSSVPIYASEGTARRLWYKLPGIERNLVEFKAGEQLSISETTVSTFSTPHDAADSVGFRIDDGYTSLGFCTDLGYVPGHIVDKLSGCDVAVIESNHDVEMLRYGAYPYHLKTRILSDTGHLSNEACAGFAARLAERGTRSIVLAHLSRENNRPDKAYDTTALALAELGCDVKVTVAPAESFCRVEAVPCKV